MQSVEGMLIELFVGAKGLAKKSAIVRRVYFYLRFIVLNGYFPSFNNPKTFNEKINFRKKYPMNTFFARCADKILVRDYVASKVEENILTELYYVADQVSPEDIREIVSTQGDCFLKANHNSGPVFLLTRETCDSTLFEYCKNINQQLTVDFGLLQNESWYSAIEPKILIEKKIPPEKGDSEVRDYKFHVFKQNDGTYKIILQIDFDRSSNHNRTFFDEQFRWIPFSVKYPCVRIHVEKPLNFDKMLAISKKLAEPFSYVRVDLYNSNGHIYFGEMTFAQGSGAEKFTDYAYDLWMGRLWKGDPSY